jgi:hypothetical protein
MTQSVERLTQRVVARVGNERTDDSDSSVERIQPLSVRHTIEHQRVQQNRIEASGGLDLNRRNATRDLPQQLGAALVGRMDLPRRSGELFP